MKMTRELRELIQEQQDSEAAATAISELFAFLNTPMDKPISKPKTFDALSAVEQALEICARHGLHPLSLVLKQA
jgi:hypothetical protein